MENPEQQQPQPQYQPQPEFTPPTPPAQPQYPQPEQPQTTVPSTDPGKTLGIVGFVFAFIFLHAIGLPLSIAGYVKSKKAGFSNPLALAGIILNSIFLVLLVPFILLGAITAISYSGITDRANNSTSQSSAATVVKWTELYNADNGTYPTRFADLENTSDITNSPTPFLFSPSSPNVVEFYSCGNVGNKVGYYDYDKQEVEYMYSGTANYMTQCVLTED